MQPPLHSCLSSHQGVQARGLHKVAVAEDEDGPEPAKAPKDKALDAQRRRPRKQVRQLVALDQDAPEGPPQARPSRQVGQAREGGDVEGCEDLVELSGREEGRGGQPR